MGIRAPSTDSRREPSLGPVRAPSLEPHMAPSLGLGSARSSRAPSPAPSGRDEEESLEVISRPASKPLAQLGGLGPLSAGFDTRKPNLLTPARPNSAGSSRSGVSGVALEHDAKAEKERKELKKPR